VSPLIVGWVMFFPILANTRRWADVSLPFMPTM